MSAAGSESSLLLMLLSQALTYGVITWLIWIAITFLAARWGGPLGMIGGWILVTIILSVIDVRWIQGEMSKPGWDGTPDMDIVFDIGLMIRAVIFNGMLLPIVFLALWMRRRDRRRKGMWHRQHPAELALTPSAPPPTPRPG